MGLVPVHDLPLQATLSFEASPDDIALTYLECVALSEGYAVTRDVLADVHKPLHLPLTTDTSDDLISSRFNASLPVTDIRRSINQLQYLCKGYSEDTIHCDVDVGQVDPPSGLLHYGDELRDPEQLHDWEYGVAPALPNESNLEHNNGHARARTSSLQVRDLTRMSDALSAADSHVRRRPESSLEVSERISQGSSDD